MTLESVTGKPRSSDQLGIQKHTDQRTPDEVARHVIEILEAHQTRDWLSKADITISGTTRFDDLRYDAIDKVRIGVKLEKAFEIACPATLRWPDTVDGLTGFVLRGLDRVRRMCLIRDYFATTWKPMTDEHVASGWALLERIKLFEPERILDLGCGDNQFKPYFPNLVGLDVTNPKADILKDVLAYDPFPTRFDVIIALGSINFGREADILDELHHAASLLSQGGRIIMRVNPGIRWADCPDLEIFPWSVETINSLGLDVGLKVEGEIVEDTGRNGPRLVFVYRKTTAADGAGHLRVSDLPRRPSALRAACNRARRKLSLPSIRRSFVSLAGMFGDRTAPIDTTTDKVIWVSFPPALSGHAVARMLSASPDVYWDSSVQKIEPLELMSPHDWMRGVAVATCHYAKPMQLPMIRRTIGEIKAKGWPFSNPAELHKLLREQPRSLRARLEACVAQDLPYVQAVHVPPGEIARLFPNCRIVAVVDDDPLGFWLRALHEKKSTRYWPKEIQIQRWRGGSLEEAFSRCSEQVPVYDGRPANILERKLNEISPDDRTVRRYYRQKGEDFRKFMREQETTANTIRVDRGRLFDPDTCTVEYERMCAALRITPVSDEVAHFCRDYMSHQWHRPLPDGVRNTPAIGQV
jgi:SAM-dependent methyltransferase